MYFVVNLIFCGKMILSREIFIHCASIADLENPLQLKVVLSASLSQDDYFQLSVLENSWECSTIKNPDLSSVIVFRSACPINSVGCLFPAACPIIYALLCNPKSILSNELASSSSRRKAKHFDMMHFCASSLESMMDALEKVKN